MTNIVYYLATTNKEFEGRSPLGSERGAYVFKKPGSFND